MKFPTLYKKTSTGAIQYWHISAEEANQGFTFGLGWIRTVYGQLGTENPQITDDIIKEGKNTGKKNATTPIQQAEAEAKAKWEKQKKKGYVESIEAAQAGELDDLIEGGIEPMLAHPFSKHGHKIVYPCYVQPKLDGIRCIAIVKNGKCTLWSRTRKLITGVPHIARELEKLFPQVEVTFDGELYNHQFKKDFEKIVSFVRQEEPAEGHEIVEYHVYDMPIEGQTFEKRSTNLKILDGMVRFKTLKLVETALVMDENEATEQYTKFKTAGYEGTMLRNANGLYLNKRSYDLQKVKEFDDAEFQIIGIEEGRGKLAGHVGSFVCVTKTQKQFLAKMAGDTDKLKEYFNKPSLWQGKILTVQYQGLTGKEGVPRFPVGKAIRDYE